MLYGCRDHFRPVLQWCSSPSLIIAQVYVSWLACAAFAFGALPALVATTGWAGLVKFWLMPWLGYHFWMSTFTVTPADRVSPALVAQPLFQHCHCAFVTSSMLHMLSDPHTKSTV